MRILLIAASLIIAFTLAVRAEKVDVPRAGLEKMATHVVTGEVKAVYTRTKRVGRWRYDHHVAEIKIATVEKGEGLTVAGLVYARYWRRTWIAANAPPPSTHGHRNLPKEGETLRIYLARNAYDGFTKDNKDGGFNVIGANGFERMP